MQLTSTITALLALTASAFAAPIEDRAIADIEARASTWTVQNFKRVCNTANTSCAFTYSINKNDGTTPAVCNYKRTGTTVSHASYSGVKCGAFTINSGWSSQGFTTLSMVTGGQIIFPAYTDAELNTNKVVKPNKSYTPEALP